ILGAGKARSAGDIVAWEPVGFWSRLRPDLSAVVRRTKEEGLGNLARALAWVALFLRASPVRAPENAGAIHIDRTQIQITFIDSSKRPAVMPPLSYYQLVRIGREKRLLVAIDSAQEISNELRVVR